MAVHIWILGDMEGRGFFFSMKSFPFWEEFIHTVLFFFFLAFPLKSSLMLENKLNMESILDNICVPWQVPCSGVGSWLRCPPNLPGSHNENAPQSTRTATGRRPEESPPVRPYEEARGCHPHCPNGWNLLWCCGPSWGHRTNLHTISRALSSLVGQIDFGCRVSGFIWAAMIKKKQKKNIRKQQYTRCKSQQTNKLRPHFSVPSDGESMEIWQKWLVIHIRRQDIGGQVSRPTVCMYISARH